MEMCGSPCKGVPGESLYLSEVLPQFIGILPQVIAAAGVASRRAAEELIFEGKVSVNKAVVTVPQTLVTVSKDQVGVPPRPSFLICLCISELSLRKL
jgi:hypothetical protein